MREAEAPFYDTTEYWLWQLELLAMTSLGWFVGKGMGNRTVERESFGLISVIMAAYNAEKTIIQAIESVLNQTYPHFELLVVNDCSTDRTVELVKKKAARDRRVRLISNRKNSGVSCTRKHGLDEARGEWIAILDSDDAWARKSWKNKLPFREK